MGKTLDLGTTSRIRETIDQQVHDGIVPGLLYFAVDRDGDLIFSHAAGNRGMQRSNDPMTTNTVFWIASFTKLITSIACMQLVEQGKLSLDDADQVTQLAPELSTIRVLQRDADASGGFRLEERTKSITLRMLLTHTAGFGYAFDDPKLHDWSLPIGLDDFSADLSEFLCYPLVNQPGTFQYGLGIDWAGILVERATKLTLDDYIQKYIVQPLGLKNITFLPSISMLTNLAYMHQREPDGTLHQTEHVYRRPLVMAGVEGDKKPIFHMGGAGCFACPEEYCQIIATLLNDGTNRKASVQLLKPETVETMFQDQIPNNPCHANEPWQTAKTRLANPTAMSPTPEGDGQEDTFGWGLSFALSLRPSATGRAAGSASWEGLPNLYWFADRKSGLGAVLATQVLPYGDKEVVRLSEEVETMVYDGFVRQNK